MGDRSVNNPFHTQRFIPILLPKSQRFISMRNHAIQSKPLHVTPVTCSPHTSETVTCDTCSMSDM